MRRTCLALLAVLIVGCGAKSTPTIAPPPTRDVAATVVASHWMTVTAEAVRVPTTTPTDTPTPTATATPTDTPTPTPPPAAQLEGQVLDEVSGQPLAGAQVAAGERQATTDSEGRFVFADLAPGPYTVLVTAAEHDPVLSGIVDARAGEQVVVDAALPAAGTTQYPRDPMASNQIDPAGAPSAQDAERLARLQGLQGEVVAVREVTLEGEHLVNYRKGDAVRAAMATLNHPAWELVDEAGQAWYIIRVCGNLAVVRALQVEVPSQCVAQPHPVVTVGSQPVNAYTCPDETCSVAVELPAGWHGVALECATGCVWLRVQYPGIDGSCWVRRDWLQTWGELAGLPVGPVAVSGQIAFFSDRDSPGYGEIYRISSDGSGLTRQTSSLRVPSILQRGAPGVDGFGWSGSTSRYVYSAGGVMYTVGPSLDTKDVLTDRAFYAAVSPDGQRVAFMMHTAEPWEEIAIINIGGSGQTRLTDDPERTSCWFPTWSPDGRQIAYRCVRAGHSIDLCVVDADEGKPELLIPTGTVPSVEDCAWSPDGRYLVCDTLSVAPNLYIVDLMANTATRLPQEGWMPSWSPNSSQIAFQGRDLQIWIINADGSGLRKLTTEGKNCCPVWLP